MQTPAREAQMLELIEEAEDAMRRLISEFSVYALEVQTARHLARNGFGGERAAKAITELQRERERLVSGR
jgi:SOS response regulatory protein OraA/RecX